MNKVRVHDGVTWQKFEQSFKGDEDLISADILRSSVLILYSNDISWTFINNDTYEQHALANSVIEDELPYFDRKIRRRECSNSQ